MKKIFEKLLSCAGESIGETLIALLISSLALLMLAGAISAATRIVTVSKTKMDDYYEADNTFTEYKTRVSDRVSVTMTRNDTGSPNQVFVEVPYIENNTFDSIPTIMYSVDIETETPGGEG